MNLRRLLMCLVGLSSSWGAVLWADAPPASRIPFSAAESRAQAVVSGKVLSSSLEQEKRSWVYVFEIRSKNRKIHRVSIDADNGKLLSHSVEAAGKYSE